MIPLASLASWRLIRALAAGDSPRKEEQSGGEDERDDYHIGNDGTCRRRCGRGIPELFVECRNGGEGERC